MSRETRRGHRSAEITDTGRTVETIDVFIHTFGGHIRLRDLNAALLILKATAADRGIHVSELARRCDAPAESVRRLVATQAELGYLDYQSDPRDERMLRIVATKAGVARWDAQAMSRALGHSTDAASTALSALIQVVDTFLDHFPSGMRIRGIKIALLIQLATLHQQGISASELARLTGASPETVRRHMTKHVELGTVRFEPDPEDERVIRFLSCSLEHQNRTVSIIARQLAAIDWGEQPPTNTTA